MNYQETFITIAPDCPVDHSVIPTAKGDSVPIHLIQYELLTQHPYTFTEQELIFETHVRRLGLSNAEIKARCEEIWNELFSKQHACLRSSTLAKKYGWGFHYDSNGRIAIYAMESNEYEQISRSGNLKILPAMRSKRA
jgi:hypothetical protein